MFAVFWALSDPVFGRSLHFMLSLPPGPNVCQSGDSALAIWFGDEAAFHYVGRRSVTIGKIGKRNLGDGFGIFWVMFMETMFK